MSSSRILILRPDNIGDVVLFSGALQHIRNLYPYSHITLAVQEHIVNLVELCPFIDDCISANRLTWWGRFEHFKFPLKHKLEKFFHMFNKLWNVINKKSFDILVYPIKSPSIDHLKIIYCMNSKSTYGIIGCRLCSPKTGYPSELQPETLFTHYLDISSIDAWQHELLTTLDFLRFLGCHITTADDIKPQFWLSDSEINYLDGTQRNGQKIIGLFPGASYEGRCWEASNYGELAKILGSRPIYAIFGSSADVDLADRVALSIKERNDAAEILNLVGKTTLRELVRTITCCDLFISMETSGLHMAIVANIPAIGIVGGGHFGRFVPWGNHAKHMFLTHKVECFHCNWTCTQGEVKCINNISPRDVASAAINLLGLNVASSVIHSCKKE